MKIVVPADKIPRSAHVHSKVPEVGKMIVLLLDLEKAQHLDCFDESFTSDSEAHPSRAPRLFPKDWWLCIRAIICRRLQALSLRTCTSRDA